MSVPQSIPLELAGRPVLLATDGSPAAKAATRFALALAERSKARINVLTVIDSSVAPIPPGIDVALAMTDATVGSPVHVEQAEELRASIAELTRQPRSFASLGMTTPLRYFRRRINPS
jgi:nucleotide-binding universal stress UspA family protein